MNSNNKSGFTLLEIIIVIIIVGVLASLALPRFFSTVEYSKSTEALSSISAIRQSLERCYLMKAGTYVGCTNLNSDLDIANPGNSVGAHFAYAVNNASANAYDIVATRNTFDGGDNSSTVTVRLTATGVTRSGTGVYSGLK